MVTIIILTIAFIIMIAMPLLGAYIYFRVTDGVILHINQNMIKDPRYFSHSFTGMIERALPTMTGNTIKLSREEQVLRAHDLKTLQFTSDEAEVDQMVLAIDEDMEFPEKVKVFNKEIYSNRSITVDNPGVNLRAIYSADNMSIGNKTSVVRWADAENTLSIHDDCELGMAASAGHILSLGKNVKFRRLYAPVIYFGQYPSDLIDPMEGRDPGIFMLPVIPEKKKIQHVTGENMTEAGTAPFSVVSNQIMIKEGAILQGDIHSDGNVRICEGAGVIGNIFAEKSIVIEKGAFVLGNVFSQERIEIGQNVMIGKEGRIVSVIARDKLTVGANSVVYGYVSSETMGISAPIYNPEELRYSGRYKYAKYVKEKIFAVFGSLSDYERADSMAYRKNESVEYARIPDGATVLKRSMFCGCINLKRMILPASLKEIQDYSLMDCKAMERITSFEDTQLERLGVSSLENCEKITELHFPESLVELKAASCAGMKGLLEVTFPAVSNLQILGDHSFRGCSSLTSMVLPDSVEKVGISSFRDCESLKYLSINEKIKDEPGIKELPEILPDLIVEYRQGDESENERKQA